MKRKTEMENRFMEKKFTWLGFLVFNVIFVALISYLLWDSFTSYNLVTQVRKEVGELQEKVEEVSERKKIIEGNIAKFTEEEKMERIARDRLNLAKEGEVTLRIIK